MNKTMNSWLLALVLPFSLNACTGTVSYSAESLTATVVDADTGLPLEGVVVVANWQLEEATLGGNIPAGQLMVMESVTNTEGVFHIQSWGPKAPKKGHLGLDDPQLLIFKSGYEFMRLSNSYSNEEARQKSIRKSDWNGRVIRLKRFSGSHQMYADHLSSWPNVSLEVVARDDCGWKAMPRMLVALRKQSHFLRDKKISESFISADYIRTNPDVCGNPEVFFKNLPE